MIEKISKLARIGLTKEEIEKSEKEISGILDYFNLLKEVDVSNIEPTFHPLDNISNVARKDEYSNADIGLIEMAPNKKDRHIKVKTVL